MLWFTSGRAPTAVRRSPRDIGSWLETAQSAAQSAVQSIDAPAMVASIDAPKAVQRAREGIAEAARQARLTAAELGDELKSTNPDAVRKQVLLALPTRRKRASRRRGVMLALAALTVAGLAAMAVTRLLRRPRAPRLPADWTPGQSTSISSASSGGMTGVMDAGGLPTPAGSTGAMGGSVRDAQAAMSGATTSTTATGGATATTGLDGTHPPVGLPPDASTVPATFDRDAEIRAAGEGMEPPEGGLPGPSTRSVADGE